MRLRFRAYTLLEILIVVAILGIAAAMVVPNIGSVGTFRVQAAVRVIVSDLTAAQADAIAFQQGRAIAFYPGADSRYEIYEVNGPQVPDADLISTTRIRGEQFGGAQITNVTTTWARPATSGGSSAPCILFDEVGAPLRAPQGDPETGDATIRVVGSGQTFDIKVEAYTGRVTVTRVAGP